MEFVSCGLWRGLLGQGLAERELSCLLAVAAGQTDKQIAQRDGVSPRSIKGRIESAMFKLGVYKRAALVAEAMRLGLIQIASSGQPAGPELPHSKTESHAVLLA